MTKLKYYLRWTLFLCFRLVIISFCFSVRRNSYVRKSKKKIKLKICKYSWVVSGLIMNECKHTCFSVFGNCTIDLVKWGKKVYDWD